jgi:hypothetical protein
MAAEGLGIAEPVVEDPWAATKAMRNAKGTSTCMAVECKGAMILLLVWEYLACNG